MKKTFSNAIPMPRQGIKKLLLIMKLALTFVLLSVLQVSANVYSQSTVNLDVQDKSLRDVLKTIEQNSSFRFFYSDDLIFMNRSVDIKADNQKVTDVLNGIFESSDLTYKVFENNLIVIVPKSEALQDFNITGVVRDSEGFPLPGVNVLIEGTTVGVISDANGKFSLNVPNENSVLVFSYVGFLSEKVAVGSQRNIEIKLIEDIQNLQEVVVTALGIKREKKALGYAISSIKGEELVKSSTPINPLMALYGKAAGVKISGTSGGPAAGMVINIRNSVSLTESTNTRPLFVVDGIPIFDENTGSNRNDREGRDRGTGINDVNAEDIASIEILKGAKAAVLYGYAGANGVVLITTKAGSKAKGLGIDFSISNTWDKVAFYPEYQNEFGTGSNLAYAGIDPNLTDKEGFRYDMVNGVKTPIYFTTNEGFSFGPKMDGRDILWYDGVMRPYSSQKDNYSELFRTGHLRTINFSIANNGEIGDLRFSYTNKDYQSPVFEAYQRNHNISITGNLKTGNRIKLGFATNYYNTFNHNAPFRIQDAFVTYGIARDLKVDLLKSNVFDETGRYSYFRNRTIANKVGGAVVGSLFNEYIWNQSQNVFDETRHHLIQSLNFDVKLAKGLNWTTLGGFDMTRFQNEVKMKVTRPLYEDPFQGYYSMGERNVMNLYMQSYLNFDQKISEKFQFNAMFGGVYKDNTDRRLSSITRDFQIENYFHLGNSTDVDKVESNGSRGRDVLYSVLGSAQISYNDMLFAEFSGRNDWSSILPPSNNRFFYPGVSLSWVMSQAFQLPEFVKYAKTRVSWADVGRPGPRYFGNQNFEQGSYGGVPYLIAPSELPPADYASVSNTLPVENLKPERKREVEAGLEFYLFSGNRLTFDMAYYQSHTYDQIMALTVPAASGVSKIKVNAGDIQNNGFEFQVKGIPVLTNNFSWDVTLNISHNTSEVKKLAKGVTTQPLWGVTGAKMVAEIGKPYGEIFITPWLRDSVSGKYIVNADGLYQFDREHPKKVGKLQPDWMGGLSSNVNYKGFALGFDIDYQFGGTLLSQTNMYLKGNGSGEESLKYRDEARGGMPYYVTADGKYHQLPSHDAAVPSDSKYSFIFHDGVVLPGIKADKTANDIIMPAQRYYVSTYWQGGMDITEDAVYKSDYVNLRRITLSYQIPSKFTQKLKIQRAQVAAFATNVMYLYKDVPNVTPESFAGTNEFTEYSNMPGIRSYGLELKFSF
jgi:iron complex outermembrane receptor protein